MKKLFLAIFRPDKYIGEGLYKGSAIWKTYALTSLTAILSAIAYFPDKSIETHIYQSVIMFTLEIIGIHIEITLIYLFMKMFKLQRVNYGNLTKTMLLTVYFIYMIYCAILNPLIGIVSVTRTAVLWFMRLWKSFLIYLVMHSCYKVNAKRSIAITGGYLAIETALYLIRGLF